MTDRHCFNTQTAPNPKYSSKIYSFKKLVKSALYKSSKKVAQQLQPLLTPGAGTNDCVATNSGLPYARLRFCFLRKINAAKTC